MRAWLATLGLVAMAWCVGVSTVYGQNAVLLDRVLARVSGSAVTLSDVRAGRTLGLVVAPEDDTALATEQWLQRLLLLDEVERFPPAEPTAAAVDQEEARMLARLGPARAELQRTAGIDAAGLRNIARDTLRIRAYLEQRFGSTVQASDEDAAAYYRTHPDEFTVGGVLQPYQAVAADARARASAARRQAAIEHWMADLRARADVVLVAPGR